MKIIKKFTKFKSGSHCIELNKLIETYGEWQQFKKEYNEFTNHKSVNHDPFKHLKKFHKPIEFFTLYPDIEWDYFKQGVPVSKEQAKKVKRKYKKVNFVKFALYGFVINSCFWVVFILANLLFFGKIVLIEYNKLVAYTETVMAFVALIFSIHIAISNMRKIKREECE